jgi:hypothetical protein
LAYEKIAGESPAAAQLLELCAFLDPDYIPTRLFVDSPNLLPRELAVLARDELLFNDAIGVIRRYSLMAMDHEHMRIHRLVQIIIANRLNPIDKEARLRCVLLLMNSMIARDYTVAGHTTGYESQALILADRAQNLPGLKGEATELLYTVGRNYEGMSVEHPLSVPILERALLGFEELYGSDHLKVAAVLMNLAYAMDKLNRRKECRHYRERALGIMEVQDPDSLDFHGRELLRLLQEPFWEADT